MIGKCQSCVESYLKSRTQETFLFKMSYIFDSSMSKSTEYRKQTARWINAETAKKELIVAGYQILRTDSRHIYKAINTRTLSCEQAVDLSCRLLKCKNHEFIDRVQSMSDQVRTMEDTLKALNRKSMDAMSMVACTCRRCQEHKGKKCYRYTCPLWPISPYSLENAVRNACERPDNQI